MTPRPRRRLALLLALLLLSGCGGEGEAPAAPSPSPSGSVALTPTPTPSESPQPAAFALPCRKDASFHPITGQETLNLLFASLIYEGLFTLDHSFSPAPLLCDTWQVSQDGLTWTFTLREGITFSDGSPLTAAEAVSSLRTARGAGSRFQNRLGIVTAVKETGERSFTISLAYPNGALPALLDIPIVKETEGRPLGTGDYTFSEDGESLVLRQDRQQKGETGRESIPLQDVGSAEDLISAFDTQAVSLVPLDPLSADPPCYSSLYTTTTYPTTAMLYVGYNADKGRPCEEALLRQALSLCYDRASLCAGELLGCAREAALPISPCAELYSDSIAASLAFADAQAPALLEQAGWQRKEDGSWTRGRETLALSFVVNSDNPVKVSTAQAITRGLQEAGFPVTLTALTWEAYVEALERGDFDLYLGEVQLTADFDLTPFLAPEGALNYGKFRDDTLSSYLSVYLAAQGGGRAAAARQFFREFGRQAPFTPLCFEEGVLLTHESVFWTPAPTQQDLLNGIFP